MATTDRQRASKFGIFAAARFVRRGNIAIPFAFVQRACALLANLGIPLGEGSLDLGSLNSARPAGDLVRPANLDEHQSKFRIASRRSLGWLHHP